MWAADIAVFAGVFKSAEPRLHPLAYYGHRYADWLSEGEQILALHDFVVANPPTGDRAWEVKVDEHVAVLQGLDGRKMSKSYGNTIALFGTPKQLQKSINKMKTNLLEPGDPKETDDSTVFQIWCAFADVAERERMHAAFAEGIA